MKNVENKEINEEKVETTEVTETTQPAEEVKEDKFIVLPEALVQDIMTYLGTKPANETINFINGVSSTAQYATMQPLPDQETPEAEK